MSTPVPMRTTPTTLDFSGNAVTDFAGGAYGYTSVTISAGNSGINNVMLVGTIVGGTAGRWCYLRANGGSDFVGLGAEL
jgi:hypothetical protein